MVILEVAAGTHLILYIISEGKSTKFDMGFELLSAIVSAAIVVLSWTDNDLVSLAMSNVVLAFSVIRSCYSR